MNREDTLHWENYSAIFSHNFENCAEHQTCYTRACLLYTDLKKIALLCHSIVAGLTLSSYVMVTAQYWKVVFDILCPTICSARTIRTSLQICKESPLQQWPQGPYIVLPSVKQYKGGQTVQQAEFLIDGLIFKHELDHTVHFLLESPGTKIHSQQLLRVC